MRRISDLLFWIRAVFGADRMEHDLAEELQFHVEMETEKYLRQGDAPEVARARAEGQVARVQLVEEVEHQTHLGVGGVWL